MQLGQHHLVILKRIMFVIAMLTCGVACSTTSKAEA
jgi:hypothetical protein